MESALDYHSARALLEWQVELGATEAILDAPLDRYEAPQTREKPAVAAAPAAPKKEKIDPVAVAKTVAGRASDLTALKDALSTFAHCTLKNGARSMVFQDGLPNARVMVIGEAPGRDEDKIGRPFVGKSGQLFDRMFAAIDLDRGAELAENSVYTTYVLPWRPPQNWTTRRDDIAMMAPFVQRHIELANPDLVILMGNVACEAVLGKRGVTRLRGDWVEACGKPVLPMLTPDKLMEDHRFKRDAWGDLLSLKSRLTNKP